MGTLQPHKSHRHAETRTTSMPFGPGYKCARKLTSTSELNLTNHKADIIIIASELTVLYMQGVMHCENMWVKISPLSLTNWKASGTQRFPGRRRLERTCTCPLDPNSHPSLLSLVVEVPLSCSSKNSFSISLNIRIRVRGRCSYISRKFYSSMDTWMDHMRYQATTPARAAIHAASSTWPVGFLRNAAAIW